jgi:hypothetical protein
MFQIYIDSVVYRTDDQIADHAAVLRIDAFHFKFRGIDDRIIGTDLQQETISQSAISVSGVLYRCYGNPVFML